MSPFLSDCPSLMLGIAIHCIQHSQATLERGVCELAHSFFHFFQQEHINDKTLKIELTEINILSLFHEYFVDQQARFQATQCKF